MGHEPGPRWQKSRLQPMVKLWCCIQATTIVLGFTMLIISQSSIKGGYTENSMNLSKAPLGDISSST